jgi:hypothetical protein
MNFWDNVMQKWNLLREKSAPAMQVAGKVAKSTGNVLSTIWRYIKAFKKVWLTIPVVVGAIMLALHNLTHLPKVVGLNLQTDGVFALQIPRGTAVFVPLVITLICLLLMWCSRRTLTPWFACLVSLALPVVILIMNTFPG